MYRIDLRRVILMLCLGSVIAILVNGLFSSLMVQRAALIESTLEANRVYADKLAVATHVTLENAQLALRYAAYHLAADPDFAARAPLEASRVWHQSSHFNAVAIVDQTATILTAQPQGLKVDGRQLLDDELLEAIASGRPYITEPFRGLTGRWLVTLTHPLISPTTGESLGVIAGSISLHEANVLHTLLAEQTYRDGSYVYVVDRAGNLIYHPDPSRVGDNAFANPLVPRVLAGEAGADEVVNTQGVRMLAGFAPVEGVNWGVVSQRAYDAALSPLDEMMWNTARNALPALILIVLVIWWTSVRIVSPLRRMASAAHQLDGALAVEQVTAVNAWYAEAAQLRRALIAGLSSLQRVLSGLRHDSVTDPLTGLLNRRGLHSVLEEAAAAREPFGVVCFDVDHFKRINDVDGHAVGDAVLSALGEIVRANSREEDVACRIGGEEFLVVLPGRSLADAAGAAKRLRQAVETAPMPGGKVVTISLGVSHWPGDESAPQTALAAADAAMYEAKRAGRNRVNVAAQA